jgi:hypothetical protein
VRRGFSPLDEELELLAGAYTPSLVESVVRLGTWMPFESVTKGIEYFLKVNVSEPTARRKTEAAGEAYVEVQTAKVEALEARPPESPKDEPKGPAVQLLSVDGAMVPLVGKRWSEVKTLVIGRVGEPKLRGGELEVHTEELSYFSRMTDHATFGRLATVETYRRGTPTATVVCAVNDGAGWEQGFVDLQRPDAVRILDFGHSAEHLAEVSQALYGIGTLEAQAWLKAECHELRHGDSEKVLGDLRALIDGSVGIADIPADPVVPVGQPAGLSPEVREVVRANLEYFEKRKEQIRYSEFERLGYPIGSGAVESGNKLVVEARLKGSGMHWADQNVDPMVALRTVACSDRWEEAWPEITDRLRAQVRDGALARRARRKAAKTQLVETAVPVTVTPEPSEPPRLAPATVRVAPPKPSASQPTDQAEPGISANPRRPAANHPWRHMLIGRARTR